MITQIGQLIYSKSHDKPFFILKEIYINQSHRSQPVTKVCAYRVAPVDAMHRDFAVSLAEINERFYIKSLNKVNTSIV
jgi:hypothetical protein